MSNWGQPTQPSQPGTKPSWATGPQQNQPSWDQQPGFGQQKPGTQGTQGWGTQGTGIQGTQGTQGWGSQGTGTQGTQGTQGWGNQGTGTQGTQGWGAQGTQGGWGTQGTGTQGTQGWGTQGTGTQGTQGWGAQGTQGTQGTQGWGAQGTGTQGGTYNQGQGFNASSLFDPNREYMVFSALDDDDLVLDVSQANNATKGSMIIWEKNNGKNQRFRFVSRPNNAYQIVSVLNNFTVEVPNNSTANGA